MYTTFKFQIKPNYYKSEEECKESYKNIINTNPRYKFYNQTHFTAGDIEQFEMYRDKTNGHSHMHSVCLKNNIWYKYNFYDKINWNKYKNIYSKDVTNTFNYIFHKFKKGVFIKIKNNELSVFLPFSKYNYTNEWSNYIKINPKFNNMYDYIKYIYNNDNIQQHKISINKFINYWYCNNSLLRYEFPLSEGDNNIPALCDMLEELCKNKTIPDIEFFVNNRDFPLIKKDDTEPYEHIYNDINKKLVSHMYNKYTPILSMVTNKEYADIAIPNCDDWTRVSSREKKFFPRSRKIEEDFSYILWENKIPTAIFRGSSTGTGVTIETNPRLKISQMSKESPVDEKGIPYLDAGITSWNIRPRKIKGEQYLETIDIKKLQFGLKNKLSLTEQCKYKYLVNIDGHVSSFRLSSELGMGCCILLVESNYKLWFSDFLEPFVHYIPIKKDLSDLIEKIKWCKDNDDKCKKIVENCKFFYNTYLQKEGILDYLQKILIDLKNQSGFYIYNVVNELKIQLKIQKKYLIYKKYPTTIKNIEDINQLPNQYRSYSLLKGFQYIVNMILNNKGNINNIINLKKLSKNNEIVIFDNKNTKIVHYDFYKYSFLIKYSKKKKEIIHESFIGLYCINKLSKYSYNFSYTFGYYKYNNKYYKISEYIKGQTLKEYINSDYFNIDEYILILLQIALSLHIAQQKYCFVHYDLTPWNIVLKVLDNPIDLYYNINLYKVYKIRTRIIPVIIDYGKSHIVHKKFHYGFVKLYKTSNIQDLLSILITSLYEITNRKINIKETKEIIKLSNFFTGTKYKYKKFIFENNGLQNLKIFLRKSKKYSELLENDKYELEKLTPIDFVNYIKKNFDFNYFYIEKKFNNIYNTGSPEQVFHYTLSSNTQEQLDSFNIFFNNFNINDISKNIEYTSLKLYYIQKKFIMFNSVYILYNTFINTYFKNNIIDIFDYNKIIYIFNSIYNNIINSSIYNPILNNYNFNKELITYPIESDTFTNIYKISECLKILNFTDDIPYSIIKYNKILQYIINYKGKFFIPNNIRIFLNKEFLVIKNLNTNTIINNISLKHTFLFYLQKIHKKNLSFLNLSKNNNLLFIKEYEKY